MDAVLNSVFKQIVYNIVILIICPYILYIRVYINVLFFNLSLKSQQQNKNIN